MNISNPEFVSDLSAVLNKHSIDNDLATPDFILAEFLVQTLDNLAEMQARSVMHEHESAPKNPRIFQTTMSPELERALRDRQNDLPRDASL